MIRALSVLVFLLFSTPLFADFELFPIHWKSLSPGQKFFIATELRNHLGFSSHQDLNEEEFQSLFTKVIKNCQEQKETQCLELKKKLQYFAPYETSQTFIMASESLDKPELDVAINSINSLQTELENDILEFNQQCEDPIAAYKELYCRSLAIRIHKSNELMPRLVSALEAKAESTDCINCSDEKITSDVLTPDSLPEVAVVCTEKEKKVKQEACLKDIGCTVASSVMSFTVTPVVEIFSQKPQPCLSMQNDCITNAITSLVKSLYSLVTGIWDLIKLGVNWVGEKFWSSTSEVEDKTSDVQLMLNNMSEEDLAELKKDEPAWVSKTATAIWQGIKEWIAEDVFCEKWSGVPRASECLEPAKSLDCLSCRTILTGTCSTVGVVAGELVPALLTGGAANIASKGAKAAGVISKMIKASKSYGKIINTVDKLSELKAIKIATQNAKTIKSTAQVLTRPTRAALKLSVKNIASKHKAFVASSFYKKSALALNVAAKYSGLKYFAHLNEEAFKLGYRSVDKALTKKAASEAAKLSAAKKMTTVSPSLSAEARNLESEMRTMMKKEKRFNDIPEIIKKNSKMPGTSAVNQELQLEYYALDSELREFYQKKNREIFEKLEQNGFYVKIQSKEHLPTHQYIEIDLSKSNPNKKFIKLYRRLQKKFEFKKVQLDLKSNAELGSGAFYGNNTVDIGPSQAIEALEDIISASSQHELRHAMFNIMRKQGKKSVFHTAFYGGKNSTLMSKAPYDKFLASEEIYTYSTDFQNYAKKLEENKLLWLSDDERVLLFANVKNEANILESILMGTEDLTEEALVTVRNSLPKYKNSSSSIPILEKYDPRAVFYDYPHLVPDSNEWSLVIPDNKKRITDIPLVGKNEKELAQSIHKLTQEIEDKALEFVEKNKSKYMPSGYTKREKANALNEADKLAIERMREDYFKTAEALKLKKDLVHKSYDTLKLAEEKLEHLRLMGQAQLKEVQELNRLLSKHQDGMLIETSNETFHIKSKIHREEIQIIRTKMYKLAQNVKEKIP